MNNQIQIDSILANIQRTKKYGSIYQPTLERIIRELAKYFTGHELEKRTKRKLHQIWGAYFKRPNFSKLVNQIRIKAKSQEVKNIMRSLLVLQTSTKERLAWLDEYYQKIFQITGQPKTIVEYGCGVNAFSYAWIDHQIEYLGFDVDKELIDFINQIFKIFSFDKYAKVKLGDILIDQYPKADIYLLLKVLTLFEHQQKNISLQILEKIPAQYIAISYPTKSISGKDRGMKEFYTTQFKKLINQKPWHIKTITFDNEIVFVVKK